MLVEPGLGAFNVGGLDERHPLDDGVHTASAEPRADAVEGECADNRTDRRPDEHFEEPERSFCCSEPRQRQNDLTRQRREQILQGDREARAHTAERLHE